MTTERLDPLPDIHREMLSELDRRLSKWAECDDKILTPDRIRVLSRIADKNLRCVKLTGAQRQEKFEIRKKLRGALADIERMALLELMGGPSRWDPSEWGENNTKLPFPDDGWRTDLPVERVVTLVRRLVGMFGEEYAVPLAMAVEDGYRDHQPDDACMSVEVPIILRELLPHPPETRGRNLTSGQDKKAPLRPRYTGGSKSPMGPLPDIPEYIDGVRVQHDGHIDLAEFGYLARFAKEGGGRKDIRNSDLPRERPGDNRETRKEQREA